MDERAVAFLRELARADEDAAATLADLDELAADVDRVRVRAAELQAFFERLPADRATALDAGEEAQRAVVAARESRGRAEADAAAAGRTRDERRSRGSVSRSRHRYSAGPDRHTANRRSRPPTARR